MASGNALRLVLRLAYLAAFGAHCLRTLAQRMQL